MGRPRKNPVPLRPSRGRTGRPNKHPPMEGPKAIPLPSGKKRHR